MNKIESTNTTCNNFSHKYIVPVPARVSAKLTAWASDVSESYVKKLRGGIREDNSEKAQRVKKADSMLTDGMQFLAHEVKKVINQ